MRPPDAIGLLMAMATVMAPQRVPAQRPDAAALRQRIEVQFMSRVKSQLGLDQTQARRLGEVLGNSARERRDLEAAEDKMMATLRNQLRPGVAADTAVINKTLGALLDNRVKYAETSRTEMQQLGSFLTPVQQAQYFELRDRLMERIRQIIDSRRSGDAPARRRP